jgi:pentatricopeptide repeat protein
MRPARRPAPLLILAVPALCALGCATGRPTIEVPPIKVVAEPVGPDALEVYDAETLFLRGLDLLEGGLWHDASDYFERLIREFPDDVHVVLAHYNRGVAYIRLERGDEAVSAFDHYLRLLPETAAYKDRMDGRFKRGEALAVAKRYAEVVELFDEMLTEDLPPDLRIEALVDAGVGHYMLGLLPGGDQVHRPTAEYRFMEARRIYRQEKEKRRMDVVLFHTAQAAFYLAEISRLEFSELKLSWPSDDDIRAHKAKTPEASLERLLGDQLEEKCQRLLRAQYQYLRAIREGHAGWASAAGYNVGAMYEELYEEMRGLPTPSDLTTEQAEMYEQLVRKKIVILLEKAEKTWASTAEMVVRTGAGSEWSQKTADRLARVRARLNEEHTALATVDDKPSLPVATEGPKGRDAS